VETTSGAFKSRRLTVGSREKSLAGQAQMWDQLAVIRSIVAAEEHSDAEIMTGHSEAANRLAHHPSLGPLSRKCAGRPRRTCRRL
jgi:hypothetical protein